jgi:polyisoprenoid-binding protein YceI
MVVGAVIGILSLSAGATVSALAAERYQIDPSHAYAMFRVKHLGIGYSYGRFEEPTGNFTIDEDMPENSAIEMQLDASKVDTDVEKRDKHLRSPDFFDVEKHPQITFKSTSFKKVDDTRFEVSGDLTLLATTRPITVTAVDTGSGKDPWGNYRRGFETVFTIKRSDFGMTFMTDGVSDEVEITISVEGIRQ